MEAPGVVAFDARTSNALVGVVVPIPNLLFVSSKKKLALSCCNIPLTPANKIEPAVGANHVGVPEPPEISACPVVPTPLNAYAVPFEYGTLPADPILVAFVPPFAIPSVPLTSALPNATALELRTPELLL